MLAELVVSDLGVIESAAVLFGPGMTVLTGETGAGKTLVVGAIDLLLGGKADPMLVRPGAKEARVDGRFVVGSDEIVLSRVVPRDGRSRAYLDGRPIPLAALAEHGRVLVDLHGQHAHQSLLRPSSQRQALDAFGRIDTEPLVTARAKVREIEAALVALGGDGRSRARELDLVRYQLDELDKAAIVNEHEDDELEEEEAILADAVAHREAAHAVVELLEGDEGARNALGTALALVASRRPFADLATRLKGAVAELDDIAADLRHRVDGIEEDPERLGVIRSRRQLLRDLCRKYGDGLAAVMAFHAEVQARRDELETRDERTEALERERAVCQGTVRTEAARIHAARTAASRPMAAAIEANLRELAMPRARIQVDVHDDGEDGEVTFLLAANAGGPMLPMAKVASGGELARAMLATRLSVLGLDTTGTSGEAGPATLIFDEVDAGIGGAAALAVGRSLATLGTERQVLVVTHLPQVAAFADAHVLVSKHESGDRTTTTVNALGRDARVIELSRMLSGQPDSETARLHAEELLSQTANPTNADKPPNADKPSDASDRTRRRAAPGAVPHASVH